MTIRLPLCNRGAGPGEPGLLYWIFSATLATHMGQRQQRNRRADRATRIYRLLKGARGVSEDELWQHALFLSKSPDERCRLSLQTARSVLSSRRSLRKK